MQTLNKFAYNIFVGRVQTAIKRRTMYFTFYGTGHFEYELFTMGPNDEFARENQQGEIPGVEH